MPPPKKQRDFPFVAELASALRKLPRSPEPSVIGGRAWDSIEARVVTVMGPYDQGTVMESLVAFVKDIWMIKTMLLHHYGGKREFPLKVSLFVKTFEDSWRHWGASRFQPLGLPGTHGAFYVEVIEAALKDKRVFTINAQVYGLYVKFHALLMHIATLGRDDLFPGRIVAYGVGGFSNESLARQMQVLYSIRGSVTRESLKAAYLDKPATSARLTGIRDFYGIDDMTPDEFKEWWDDHQAYDALRKVNKQVESITLKGSPVLPPAEASASKVPDDKEGSDDEEQEVPPFEGELNDDDELEDVDDDAMED